jgi:hypothetical protein
MPTVKDAAMAVCKFAEDVGLDLDGLISLLEKHDLTLLATDRYLQLRRELEDEHQRWLGAERRLREVLEGGDQ